MSEAKQFKCECGNQNFIVVECLIWEACSDPEGGQKLSAHGCIENGIESIRCSKPSCEKEVPTEAVEVEFNG